MRRWFAYEGVWKSKQDGVWVEDKPPIPIWASPLDFVRFVKIWVNAPDLNTVRKNIFWMSTEELELLVSEVSECLEKEGYHPLPERRIKDSGLFSSEELFLLEEQGLIIPKESEEAEHMCEKDESVLEEEQEYDVVQALLNSPQASYEPLSHIQTTESGRFRAKH